jgi:hypothetical protein
MTDRDKELKKEFRAEQKELKKAYLAEQEELEYEQNIKNEKFDILIKYIKKSETDDEVSDVLQYIERAEESEEFFHRIVDTIDYTDEASTKLGALLVGKLINHPIYGEKYSAMCQV